MRSRIPAPPVHFSYRQRELTNPGAESLNAMQQNETKGGNTWKPLHRSVFTNRSDEIPAYFENIFSAWLKQNWKLHYFTGSAFLVNLTCDLLFYSARKQDSNKSINESTTQKATSKEDVFCFRAWTIFPILLFIGFMTK